MNAYEPSIIESKWQSFWRKNEVFRTKLVESDKSAKYVFTACPFTSGKAHIGHVRSYSIADFVARFERFTNDNVLFSLGFDAFGLPAEMAAIKNKYPTEQWVNICAKQMKEQFIKLGISFDWSRSFNTSEPEIYKWSQWLFLQLKKEELIYQKNTDTLFCEHCNTTLAHIQVEDGRCWRCDQPTVVLTKMQWYLKSSEYNAELDRDISLLDKWDNTALKIQKSLLGKSKVNETQLKINGHVGLNIFHPENTDIKNSEYIILSPYHEFLQSIVEIRPEINDEIEKLKAFTLKSSDRNPKTTKIIDLELSITISSIGKILPIVVSFYAESQFGVLALFGFNTDANDMVFYERINNHNSSDVLHAEIVRIAKKNVYKHRDIAISRQKMWGTPIPIIYCDKCGTVAVPISDLPVKLPILNDNDLEIKTLNEIDSFKTTKCPSCGDNATRETDTLDCYFDGLWFWIIPSVPNYAREEYMMVNKELKSWMPIYKVVWGIDGGAYILDIRFISKFLFKNGYLKSTMNGEPYTDVLMHEMLLLEEGKMSKHLGNTIEPEEIIKKHGADALRFGMLYSGAPTKTIHWNESFVELAQKFLTQIWDFQKNHTIAEKSEKLDLIPIDTEIQKSFKESISYAYKALISNYENVHPHKATRNLMKIFNKIIKFEQRTKFEKNSLDNIDNRLISIAYQLMLQFLNPIAPHITEELWTIIGSDEMLSSGCIIKNIEGA